MPSLRDSKNIGEANVGLGRGPGSYEPGYGMVSLRDSRDNAKLGILLERCRDGVVEGSHRISWYVMFSNPLRYGSI